MHPNDFGYSTLIFQCIDAFNLFGILQFESCVTSISSIYSTSESDETGIQQASSWICKYITQFYIMYIIGRVLMFADSCELIVTLWPV